MAYAELEQFKRYLHLSESSGWNEDDDEVLQDVLDDAAAHIDEECNRSFLVAPAEPETRRYSNVAGFVFTDDIAVADQLEVHADGSSCTWLAAVPSHGRPVTSLQVETLAAHVDVTARYGWSETPPPITRANLILAHRLYKRADTPSGSAGSTPPAPSCACHGATPTS